MARDYSTDFRLENEPAESGEDPVVSKKFRITIDVVATLASGPQGGVQPRSPEDVSHTKELTERLLARPGTLDRLLRRRAVEATWQAGRRILEAEYGLGGATEDELLEPIFAEPEPDGRSYFTEELEDGASAYYFDGCGATIEWASLAEIDQG